jgi:O-antigen/teichoic acid export membrane protein
MKFNNQKMAESETFSIGVKLKEAGWHTVIYGIGTVAQSASALIMLPILTEALSAEDFGAYSIILMAIGIASAIFYFGMTSALPRSYFDYESADERRAVFTTAFIFLLAGAIIQSLIGYVFDTQLSIALTGTGKYNDAIFYAMLGGAISFINIYFFAYLRLRTKSIASVLFSLITFFGTIGMTIIFLSINPGAITSAFEAVLYTQLIVAILFIVLYGKSAFIFRLAPNEVRNLLHFGTASIVASFGGLLLDSLDRLMVQHYLGLKEVGIFSAAIRVSLLINVILIAPFNQIWLPMMMENRTKTYNGELFTKVFSILMMIGGLVLICGALFATDILPVLIRSEIDASTTCVFITGIIATLIFSTTNFFSAGLFYARKVYLMSLAYYAIAITKFLVNLICIPMLGLVGAAFSTFLSCLATPFAIYLLSSKYFKFSVEWKRLGICTAIIAPSLLYGYYSAIYGPVSIASRIVWLIVSLGMIYFMCLRPAERLFLGGVLNKGILRK